MELSSGTVYKRENKDPENYMFLAFAHKKQAEGEHFLAFFATSGVHSAEMVGNVFIVCHVFLGANLEKNPKHLCLMERFQK